MKKLLLLLVLFSATSQKSLAVPIVPNFTQGSMTSHSETTSTVTETINSIAYRTGWEYSVTGVGVSADGDPINPPVNTSTVTVTPATGTTNGGTITGSVTSSYDSLNFDSATPTEFTISSPGEAFQFTQSYSGPGMTNQPIIQRVTTIARLPDTTSTFTQ